MTLDRVLAGALGDRLGEVVRLCGWAAPGAAPGEVVLSDHSGAVSLGFPRERVTPGSAIEAVGRVVAGPVLDLHRLGVPGPAEGDPPLGPGSALVDRLDWRYLDLRRPRPRLVFAVQTTLERAMRQVWDEHGFIELHTPKLMATGPRPEELFCLGYFDRRAWLAQSPQFYKQMAMAAGLERVFEVGPVFRAEATVSPRHATEFTSVDVEMAWVASEEDVMAFAESLLTRALAEVAARHGEDIGELFEVPVAVPTAPFPRFSLDQAWEVVRARGHPGGQGDLDPAGERLLSDHVAEQEGHELAWVTDYPEDLRPFYHMRSEPGSALTRSFDLVWKGLEVASGAQREHRHDLLLAQARARGLALEPIAHYLDFFRYGCPPHGGLGFGLNRLLMALLAQGDVQEVTLLPRNRARLSP